MTLSRNLGILLCSLTLAACSSTDDDKLSNKPSSLVQFKPSAKVEVRWRLKVGTADQPQLAPLVSRDAVFAASAEGKLFRLEPDTGKRIWQVHSGFALSGGIGAGDEMLLLGGRKGELAAFSQQDGKLLWKTGVSSEVIGAPRMADGIVVVRTGDGRIAGLSAQDGERLWLYERATPALVARSNASVAIRDGVIFAGFPAGKLAAISLNNGIVIWESTVSQPRGATELERISDVTSLPVVDDKQVCAVAFQGRLACFDEDRGNALWSRDFSSDQGMSLSRRYLFLADSEGGVVALDKLSGSTLWKNEQLRFRKLTAPYVTDSQVVLGDFEGYLHVLNREDGRMLARFHADGGAIPFAPIAQGDGLLVQTGKGMLYSLVIQ